MVESQSTALPLGYTRHIKGLTEKNFLSFLESGADSGNRTRTSCLEGKGTTTMQYPRIVSIHLLLKKKKSSKIFF